MVAQWHTKLHHSRKTATDSLALTCLKTEIFFPLVGLENELLSYLIRHLVSKLEIYVSS